MRRCTRVALVIVACGMTASHLWALDPQKTLEGIEHIKNMSEVERDRLNRNIQEFAGMPEDAKTHYRGLHARIVDDRMHGGSMFSLLQIYSLWVHTLSPAQQDELQRETDLAKKMALVRRIKEQQERQAKEELDQPAETPDSSKGPESGPDARQRLNVKSLPMDKKDLDAVMKLLVDDLPQGKKELNFEPLHLFQYPRIIQVHVLWKDNPSDWPDEDLMNRMSKVVSSKIARFVATSTFRGETKRDTVVRVLLLSILKQSMDTIELSDEEIENTRGKLPADEQEKIKKFDSKAREKEALKRAYFKLRNDDSYERVQECRLKVLDLFELLEVPLPKILERFKQGRDALLQRKG